MADRRPASLRYDRVATHRLPWSTPAPTGPARAPARGAVAGRVGAQPPTPTGQSRNRTTVGRAPSAMIPHGERRHSSLAPDGQRRFAPITMPDRCDRDAPIWVIMMTGMRSHRASLAYFALTELLGYPGVRTYDGSWTEWGSVVGVPIER